MHITIVCIFIFGLAHCCEKIQFEERLVNNYLLNGGIFCPNTVLTNLVNGL